MRENHKYLSIHSTEKCQWGQVAKRSCSIVVFSACLASRIFHEYITGFKEEFRDKKKTAEFVKLLLMHYTLDFPFVWVQQMWPKHSSTRITFGVIDLRLIFLMFVDPNSNFFRRTGWPFPQTKQKFLSELRVIIIITSGAGVELRPHCLNAERINWGHWFIAMKYELFCVLL